jgi:hypothetical protein
MKLLGQNCRDLGGVAAVRSLQRLQKHVGSDVHFLSETHLDDWLAECLRRQLQMDHKIVLRSEGRSGGILLLWKT